MANEEQNGDANAMKALESSVLVGGLADIAKLSPVQFTHTATKALFGGDPKEKPTIAHLQYVLAFCARHKFDPFSGTISAFVKHGKVQIMIERPSWAAYARRQPGYKGFEFVEKFDEEGKLVSVQYTILEDDHKQVMPPMLMSEWKLPNKEHWKERPNHMLHIKGFNHAIRGFYGLDAYDPDDGERIAESNGPPQITGLREVAEVEGLPAPSGDGGGDTPSMQVEEESEYVGHEQAPASKETEEAEKKETAVKLKAQQDSAAKMRESKKKKLKKKAAEEPPSAGQMDLEQQTLFSECADALDALIRVNPMVAGRVQKSPLYKNTLAAIKMVQENIGSVNSGEELAGHLFSIYQDFVEIAKQTPAENVYAEVAKFVMSAQDGRPELQKFLEKQGVEFLPDEPDEPDEDDEDE